MSLEDKLFSADITEQLKAAQELIGNIGYMNHLKRKVEREMSRYPVQVRIAGEEYNFMLTCFDTVKLKSELEWKERRAR